MIYFDTSALVKRFVNETGSLLVQLLVQGANAVAMAKIAYAEIYAGLTPKLRDGNLSKARYTVACRHFESDWRAYVRVELTDDILLMARDLIQLAAADKNLLKVAQAEELEAINVKTATGSK